MTKRRIRAMLAAAALGLGALLTVTLWPAPSQLRDFDPGAAVAGDPERGRYVLRMAGCVGCHTDSAPGSTFLAGGRAIATPIQTHPTTTRRSDVRALQDTVAPDHRTAIVNRETWRQ